jgi:hypothetical protein
MAPAYPAGDTPGEAALRLALASATLGSENGAPVERLRLIDDLVVAWHLYAEQPDHCAPAEVASFLALEHLVRGGVGDQVQDDGYPALFLSWILRVLDDAETSNGIFWPPTSER